MKLTHIDLFSGIGGFTLACQWAGIETEVFCENDKRCQDFLRRTYPGIPIVPDIREFDGTKWRGRFLLTAGVPCQPASRAGRQRGKDDMRWLWPAALRIVSEARPDWVLFENPLGINDVGLDGILTDLEGLNYEVAPPLIIPACAVNSPQLRNRYWIVAHRDDLRDERGATRPEPTQTRCDDSTQGSSQGDLAVTMQGRIETRGEDKPNATKTSRHIENIWSNSIWLPCADGKVRRAPGDSQRMAHGLPVELLEELGTEGRQTPQDCEVHRSILAALGNSIVWLVAYEIIRAIILSEGMNGQTKS